MGLDSDEAREYLTREKEQRYHAEQDRQEIEEYRRHPATYLRDQDGAFTVGEIVADVFPAGSGEQLHDTFDAVNDRDEEYRGFKNPSAAGQLANDRYEDFKEHYRSVKERLDEAVEDGNLERFELTRDEVKNNDDLDVKALTDLEKPDDQEKFTFYVHEDNL